MKKRILSLILACVLLFSAVPAMSFGGFAQALENAASVSDYEQFLAAIENGGGDEYILTADIIVPEESEAVGGYEVQNLHIDGNGYAVKGLKVKDSLFAEFKNSSVRNLTFDSASVESSEPESFSSLALVAQEISDKNSYITNCVFENCTILLPGADADAAFVAVSNYGTVTNCIVSKNSVIKNTAENDFEYRAGGITVENISGSKVINCVSGVSFDLKSSNRYSAMAGVTVRNKGKVDLCYVNSLSAGEKPVVADSSSVNNSVYRKADGSFVMGKKAYDQSDIKVLSADMSQNVMNFISDSTTTALSEADYPVLWCVSGEEPALSFDLRTAQVYLMVDETMENAKLDFSLGAVEVPVSSGRQFSVALGEYQSGSYVRNKLNINLTFDEDSYQMVNSFVYSPAYKFMENLTNPYDGTNYSKKLVVAQHNGSINTASLELLPYCWNLSLTNVSVNDEVVSYTFEGRGTEDNPFKINSAYDLCVLSKYVSQGAADKSGLKYNSAHYLLTTDLSDITVTSIGEYGNGTAFSGTFDGSAHVIRNFKVTDGKNNTNNIFGLFGYVRGTDSPAVIKNLNIVNAEVATEGDLCGIVAGQADNAVINGCVTSGTVSGGTQVSGIVGYAHNTKIHNCGSTATINTYSPNASAGGIVGYSENSVVRNCYYSGNICSNNVVQHRFIKIGGATGYLENTKLDNCFYNVNNKGTRVLFDACIKGVKEVEVKYITDDSFTENLNNYSKKAAFGTVFGKSESIIKDYPVIIKPEKYGNTITCVPTEAGTISSDFTVAEPGEIITLTPHSDNELLEIRITNLNREPVDVTLVPAENGTYIFRMPAYSVRVVPVFDAVVHLTGMGTKDDPYIITNFAEFSLMSDLCYYNTPPREGCEAYPWAYYELANDIDCNGEVLRPMGNRYYPFSGHFDGDSHTISNLIPKATDQQVSHDYAYPAIFGYCGSAEIHNVTFENISLSGSRAAVVASTVWGSTDIYNVTVRNCNFDNVRYAGGLVSQAKSVRIVNCIVDNITFNNAESSAYVIWSVMDDIYINNILVSNSKGVSSMVYSSNATITVEDYTNYYACNTDVSGERYIQKNRINIVDQSKLSDKRFIAELSENAYYINLNHMFNDFNFWGLGEEVELAHENGVVGILPIHYEKEFDDPDAFEVFSSRVYAGEIGSTIEIPCSELVDWSRMQIKTPTNNYVGHTFVDKPDGSHVLAFVMPEEPVIISNSGFIPAIVDIPGSGTPEDPYRVSRVEHIVMISDVTNGLKTQYKSPESDVDYIEAHFVLTKDIDMAEHNWTTPIGTKDNPFTGVFDGKGYSISNLNSDMTESSYFGFFGVCKSATLTNIRLTDIEYKIASRGSFVLGGLCCYVLEGTSAAPAVISNCYVSGRIEVNYVDDLGGICGHIREYNTGIERCVNETYIQINKEGGWLGGIAGVSRSNINNCANLGSIYAYRSSFLGGICGGDNSNYYNVTNCYNAGGISGTSSRWSEICPNKDQTENCYYLTGIYDVYGSMHSSFDKDARKLDGFTSGEVAYSLNKGVTDGTQVWYQNIDNGLTPEDFPNFADNKINTVYKNTTCTDEFIEYSNTEDAVIHHYNSYHVCKKCMSLEPGYLSGIYSFSVGLGGRITMNYYMVLDEQVVNDPNAKLLFDVPKTGSTYALEIPVSEADFEGGLYVFSCPVAPKELTSEIKCRILTGAELEGINDTFSYSVKQYADYILANADTYKKQVPMIKALLNYGAYAQIYFDYRTDNLANESEFMTEEDKTLEDCDLSKYQYTYAGQQQGVKYHGTSLVLDSGTDIKHYFIFNNPSDINNLYISADGKEVTPVKNGSYYNIRVDEIPAHKLHVPYETSVGEFAIYYSVLSNAYSVLEKSKNEAEKNLSKALYEYSCEARMYKYGEIAD